MFVPLPIEIDVMINDDDHDDGLLLAADKTNATRTLISYRIWDASLPLCCCVGCKYQYRDSPSTRSLINLYSVGNKQWYYKCHSI